LEYVRQAWRLRRGRSRGRDVERESLAGRDGRRVKEVLVGEVSVSLRVPVEEDLPRQERNWRGREEVVRRFREELEFLGPQEARMTDGMAANLFAPMRKEKEEENNKLRRKKEKGERIRLSKGENLLRLSNLFNLLSLSLLSLLTLSQEYVAGALDATYYQPSGSLLLALYDWSFVIGTLIFLGLGGLCLNFLLYQSKLVPRWLSVWGLVGAALVFLYGLNQRCKIMFAM